MNPFEKFTIANVAKKLNINVSTSRQKPFPKPLSYLLSHYQFKKRFVYIYSNGSIQGGYAKMITSLIDFSFIRSLVAHCYSPYGPPCYDPPSLFLLDLFRYIDGYHDMCDFLSLFPDKDRGRGYRTYAGISMSSIPSEGTFSHFRKRLGEDLYNEIFHVLVDVFHQLKMITFKIVAHDGMLYPTWARYKGCTYLCDQCASITVEEGVRLILRYKLGKMTVNEERPELLPAIAQDERSKCKNSLTAINGPSHA